MKKIDPEIGFKTELRQLLAIDQVEEVIEKMLNRTEAQELSDLHDRIVLQSSRFATLKQKQEIGDTDFDDLVRYKISITNSLLELIREMPEQTGSDEKPAQAARSTLKGISEQTLKNHILILLLSEKLMVIIFLFTIWESGAFTNEQFIGLVGLLIPVFGTYLTIIFKDTVKHRHLDRPATAKRVSRSFQRTTYFILIAYFFALVIVINLRGRGILTEFGQMSTLLALIETGLGVYIGQIITGLFGKNEPAH
jgi:hypothetical protein